MGCGGGAACFTCACSGTPVAHASDKAAIIVRAFIALRCTANGIQTRSAIEPHETMATDGDPFFSVKNCGWDLDQPAGNKSEIVVPFPAVLSSRTCPFMAFARSRDRKSVV